MPVGVTVLPKDDALPRALASVFSDFQQRQQQEALLAEQKRQFDTTTAMNRPLTEANTRLADAGTGQATAQTERTRKEMDDATAEAITKGIIARAEKIAATGEHSKAAEYVVAAAQNFMDQPGVRGRLAAYFTDTPDTNTDQRDRNTAQWLADTSGRVAAGGTNAQDINVTTKAATGAFLPPEGFADTQQREAGDGQHSQYVKVAGDIAPGAHAKLVSDTQIKTTAMDNASAERVAAARAAAAGGVGSDKAENAKLIAQGIFNGHQPPELKGLYSLGGPVRAELERKGYDLTRANQDWTATQRHLASLNGPQQLRLRQAVAFVDESMGNIETLAKEWDAGQFPILNKVQLAAAKHGALGAKAQSIATRLDGAIADGVGEMANVIMGGNSPTDSSMKLASHNLSSDWSRDTLLDNVKQVRLSLKYRKNSIETANAVANYGNPYAPDQGGEDGETALRPADTSAHGAAGPTSSGVIRYDKSGKRTQ